MRQPGTRRLLYILLALLALLYTLVGLVININVGSGSSGAAFQANYQIATDSMSLGVFILITGIPMFLLFVFLERRARRNSEPKN